MIAKRLTKRIGQADCHLLDRVHGAVIAVLVHEAGQQWDQRGVRHSDTQTHPQMRDYQLRHRSGGGYQNGADPDQQHGQNGDFATPVAISYHAKEIRPNQVAYAVRDEHRPQLPFLRKICFEKGGRERKFQGKIPWALCELGARLAGRAPGWPLVTLNTI